jgi:predicted RNA-binding protein
MNISGRKGGIEYKNPFNWETIINLQNVKLTKEEKLWELSQDQKGLQHQQENQTNVNETTKILQVIHLH